MKLVRSVFVLLSLTVGAAAYAQQPAQGRQQVSPTKAQQAAPSEADPSVKFASAAEGVIRLVDQDQLEELWEGASPEIKKLVKKSEFVAGIRQDRKRLGQVRERKLINVSGQRIPTGGKDPAGDYVSASFATQFSGFDKSVRELVSFRLDEDKTWRLSGYSVR